MTSDFTGSSGDVIEIQLERCCYTRWLGVKDEFRGSGYGRLLLLTALQEMRSQGYHRSVLNVRKNNKPAVNLYKRIGYQVTDRIFAYVKEQVA